VVIEVNRVFIEEGVTTSPKYGCHPAERTLDALLSAGTIHVDKPAGPTSHQVSAWARDIIGLDRLGHGGTLDPFATGLLTLMLGKAMRITQTVLTLDKEYIAVFRFPDSVENDKIDIAFKQLTGVVWNVPPQESAVKIRVRSRAISEFSRLDSDGRIVVAKINCVAGTYIRTLARDLGLLLDGKVELIELRRSKTGKRRVDNSVTMQELVDAIWCWQELDDAAPLTKMLQPIEKTLEGRSGFVIKDGAAAAVSHGASLARTGIIAIDGDFSNDDEIVLRTLKDEVVALARAEIDSDKIVMMKSGIVARPNIVLMEAGTYPRTWNREEAAESDRTE
jgi:H/ACA ribonucleoprotein complex subunit 4